VYEHGRSGLRAAGVRSAGPASRSADGELRGLLESLTEQVKALAVLPGQVGALSEELQRLKAWPPPDTAAAVATVAALPGGRDGSGPLRGDLGDVREPGLTALINAGASQSSLELDLHGLGREADDAKASHTDRDMFRQKQLAPSLLQHIRTSGFRNCVEYAAGHTLKGRAKHEARRLAQIVDSMVRAGVPATTEYMEIALRSLCGVVLAGAKGNPKYLELLEFFPPEACVPPGLLEALNKQATRAHRAQGPGDKKKTASHEEQ
jgi:hypothetical protein